MGIKESYKAAKEKYSEFGVDTDEALEKLGKIPIALHCWQGDDVAGFDSTSDLSGGIQATGNYPGRARTPEELMADIRQALKLIPGKHRLNLHASYAIFEKGEQVDRNQIQPKHFQKWVEFARENGLGLDFNPTMFSHPLAMEATLSSEKPEIRKFWIDHCKACLKIAAYFAEELGTYCMVNIWIPDGFKDIPADRTAPRARLKESLDEILSEDYPKDKVLVAVESKVFGIGMESCTVGSHEFYMNYAAKNDILCLLDSGHFHPTEMISDKISSMLLFADRVALHVSRPVRWDSDHVVIFDDETREIAKEIVRNDPNRVLLAMDFFDASINRIAAWVIGMRAMEKALLYALLLPSAKMSKLQEERNFTELLMLQEEMKTCPMGAVWDYYCEKYGIPTGEQWFAEIKEYETQELLKRG